ncbi:Uncharacterised protein [Mycobacterium tuberculosis]|nr:Uncharacterised protein [Mycobacterium tuberculosis]
MQCEMSSARHGGTCEDGLELRAGLEPLHGSLAAHVVTGLAGRTGRRSWR